MSMWSTRANLYQLCKFIMDSEDDFVVIEHGTVGNMMIEPGNAGIPKMMIEHENAATANIVHQIPCALYPTVCI